MTAKNGTNSSCSNNTKKIVRQSTSGALKFRDNFIEAKPIRNKSVHSKRQHEKLSDEPEITRVFVNKSLTLRSINELKETYRIILADEISPQNRNDKSRDARPKVSLREAILNRTRSEKSLSQKKALEQEEKVVRNVFRTLDKYKRGVISAETVDISTIDSRVLELISEVLFMLEDEECKMNTEQFHQRLMEKNLIGKLMELIPCPSEDDPVIVSWLVI